jgi:flavin-dependent dehydrogenase
MWDVIIAGAGPAGTIAAIVLARSGARVLLLDRARFPRDKMCGDCLNPGAVALFAQLNLPNWIDTHGLSTEGWLVTGPGGARVEGWYPRGLRGRTVTRRDLDYWLLSEALRAGAQFEDGVVVCRAMTEPTGGGAGGTRVNGVIVRSPSHGETALKARVTIAADGRRSPLAFGLGLAAHPTRPRRWAIGAYFENVAGHSPLGEMHIRTDGYLGVAQLAGGLTKVCAVARPANFTNIQNPARALREVIDRQEHLRERFADSRIATRPVVLGPLAVDAQVAGVEGLLLAGDAAGFIDPMTGDGLLLAMRGGELAADAALDVLATGNPVAHVALARRRRLAFSQKWRLNRMLREVVGCPAALSLAALGAAVVPGFVRALVSAAGDCEGRC